MGDFDRPKCGRSPVDGDRYLSDLDIDEAETLTLRLTRLYFQTFCNPSSHAWIVAMADAEAFFGDERGPIVAARTLSALKSIRGTRRSVFMFNAPSCPGCSAIATEQEQRLLASLSAMRRGEVGEARMELSMLCEGNQVDDVFQAVGALAEALSGPGHRLTKVTPMHRVLQ